MSLCGPRVSDQLVHDFSWVSSCLHQHINIGLDVQTVEGGSPSGFVQVEFQEWLRLRVIPAVREACKKAFVQRRHPAWFVWKLYQEFCAAVGHTPEGENPLFLLSFDSDPRHGMKYNWMKIDHPGFKGRVPDRRDIEFGKPGHIPVDKLKNFVPTAAKVPDAHQFPVESLFARAKTAYYNHLGDNQAPTPAQMWNSIEHAFREVSADSETVQNIFEHGDGNMRLFATKTDTELVLKGKRYYGTDGGWLPEDRRG